MIFLLPEELSGLFWRKEKDEEDEDKDEKEGKRAGEEEEEEKKEKPPQVICALSSEASAIRGSC